MAVSHTAHLCRVSPSVRVGPSTGAGDAATETIALDHGAMEVRFTGLHPDITAVHVGVIVSDQPLSWRRAAFEYTDDNGQCTVRLAVGSTEVVPADMTLVVHYYTATIADCSTVSRPGRVPVPPCCVLALVAASSDAIKTRSVSGETHRVPLDLALTPRLLGEPVKRWLTNGSFPRAAFTMNMDGGTARVSDAKGRNAITTDPPPAGSWRDQWGGVVYQQRDKHPLLVDATQYGVSCYERRSVAELLTGKQVPVEAHYLAHFMMAPRGGSIAAWEEALAVGSASVGERTDTVTEMSLCATLTLLAGLPPYRTDQDVEGQKIDIFFRRAVTVNPFATGDCEDGATTVCVLARALHLMVDLNEHSLVSQARRILDRYCVCVCDCTIATSGGGKTLHAVALLVPRAVVIGLMPDSQRHTTLLAGDSGGIDDVPVPVHKSGERVYVIETVNLLEAAVRPGGPDERDALQEKVCGVYGQAVREASGLFDGIGVMHRCPADKVYLWVFRLYAPDLSLRADVRTITPVVLSGDRGAADSRVTQIGMPFSAITDPGLALRTDVAMVVEEPYVPDGHDARMPIREVAARDVVPHNIPVAPLRTTSEIVGRAGDTSPGVKLFDPHVRRAAACVHLYTRTCDDRAKQIDEITHRTNTKVVDTFVWQTYTVYVISAAI